MRVLYLEPFDAGSHSLFTRVLTGSGNVGGEPIDRTVDWTVLTLPGRHWKWRMRGAAAWFATEHADALARPHDVVLAGSYVALAELKGLAPGLARTPAILYFHENQLAYPARDDGTRERDHHFGFTQLVSALAADLCVFNSVYNRDSFLAAGEALLERMPDAVPRDWIARVRARSRVLPVPLDLQDGPILDTPVGADRAAGPVLLWSHRWEHDKAPEAFFAALGRLVERGVPFRVIVCGERYGEAPPVFAEARDALAGRVLHWGWVESRDEYAALLRRAHIVVSTAVQEFQGIAVLEAVAAGARPLVPDRLAYAETHRAEFRYGGDDELTDALERLCRDWIAGTCDLREPREDTVAPFRAERLLPRYAALLAEAATVVSTACSGASFPA